MRFDLSANRHPGVVHPQGFRYLKQFRLSAFPVFTYEIEDIEIEKSVFMIHRENSTVIQYELRKNNHPESPKNVGLEIRLLIAFRDYHCATQENDAINSAVQERSGLASVTPYQGLPSLHLAHNAIELRKTGV
jgi:glycogen debranching enzyme